MNSRQERGFVAWVVMLMLALGAVEWCTSCALFPEDGPSSVSIAEVEELGKTLQEALTLAVVMGADEEKIEIIRVAVKALQTELAAYRAAVEAGVPYRLSPTRLLLITGTVYLEFAGDE
jgi:hypothetical protein